MAHEPVLPLDLERDIRIHRLVVPNKPSDSFARVSTRAFLASLNSESKVNYNYSLGFIGSSPCSFEFCVWIN
jgi:hypothetical protein